VSAECATPNSYLTHHTVNIAGRLCPTRGSDSERCELCAAFDRDFRGCSGRSANPLRNRAGAAAGDYLPTRSTRPAYHHTRRDASVVRWHSGPLLYVSANQVSAIVPYGDTGHLGGFTAGLTTLIQVAYQNQMGQCSFAPDVVASAPGIFTADASGLDQAAAFNQDGSVNGPDHQAAPGSVVSFYMTGLGQTNPPLSDGAVATGIAYATLQVTVTIGGQPAQVLYAGAAPWDSGRSLSDQRHGSLRPSEWRRSAVDRPGRRRSGTNGVTVAVPGPALPVPRAPATGDLRFHGVDAALHFRLDPICNNPEQCELNAEQTNVTFSNAVFSSPLMFLDECRFQVFDSTSETPAYAATFQSDMVANFQARIIAWMNGPSPVVTSLDLEPAQGQNAWSAISSQAGGFNLKLQSIAAADLQTVASQEGAASRVITAIAGSGGNTDKSMCCPMAGRAILQRSMRPWCPPGRQYGRRRRDDAGSVGIYNHGVRRHR
jgi:hypothetical protein